MLSESTTSAATQVELLKTIFHWRPDKPSHCLLRIYAESSTPQIVVLASQVASNQANPGISRDFECLARSVIQQFHTLLGEELEAVIWLKHYGRFSKHLSYTTLYDPESFVRIQFALKDGLPFKQKQETAYEAFEMARLLPWLQLTPVEEELQNLETLMIEESDVRG